MPHREIDAKSYQLFSEFLAKQCGIVLGTGKQYLVRSRLSPLLNTFNKATMTDLIGSVVNGLDRNLRTAVIDAMTTNETLWFRDGYPFELLARELLPELGKLRRKVRIWSAACSSGQEPYSIAMSILEYQQARGPLFPAGVEIIGTDLSTAMLNRCRQAEYDSFSLARGLSSQRKSRFFEPTEGNNMRLCQQVRDMVSFRPINLLDSYVPLGSFDIVFCRNVLIYFDNEVKSKILQQIAAGLQKDGILFLGASESISGLTDKFTMVRANPGLYYRKKS